VHTVGKKFPFTPAQRSKRVPRDHKKPAQDGATDNSPGRKSWVKAGKDSGPARPPIHSRDPRHVEPHNRQPLIRKTTVILSKAKDLCNFVAESWFHNGVGKGMASAVPPLEVPGRESMGQL
jgi:hypothetical protein